jgi:hypothetical protein
LESFEDERRRGFWPLLFNILLAAIPVIIIIKMTSGFIIAKEDMRFRDEAIIMEIKEFSIVVKTTGEFKITKEIFAENISDYRSRLQSLIGKEVLIEYSLVHRVSELRWRINSVKEKTITILFRDKRSSQNFPTRRYPHLADSGFFMP